MQERIQPFIVYEDSFPLDAAAEMLGCQPKKIMTEWAKGNINVVLDFGPEEKITSAIWYESDSRGHFMPPWSLADVSAPATEAYFPDELLNPRQERGGFFQDKEWFETVNPTFYRTYGQSGVYYNGKHSRSTVQSESGASDVIKAIGVLLFGYWVVPYSEFLRIHVQRSFTLKPLSNDPKESAVTATFTPGEGVRRINAPDKKNLRITESNMEMMRKLLAKRPTKPQEQATTPSETTAPQEHKHVERFALARERILAAALYVAHHHKPEIGKSFKSHAECIEKYGYLFWKDEAAPDHERITKVLSDATRRPEEWKILGGNANKKK